MDIWAAGLVLYCLCFNKHPFEAGSKLAILNGDYRLPASDPLYRMYHPLIAAMLAPEPAARPTAAQLLDQLALLASAHGFRTRGPLAGILGQSSSLLAKDLLSAKHAPGPRIPDGPQLGPLPDFQSPIRSRITKLASMTKSKPYSTDQCRPEPSAAAPEPCWRHSEQELSDFVKDAIRINTASTPPVTPNTGSASPPLVTPNTGQDQGTRVYSQNQSEMPRYNCYTPPDEHSSASPSPSQSPNIAQQKAHPGPAEDSNLMDDSPPELATPILTPTAAPGDQRRSWSPPPEGQRSYASQGQPPVSQNTAGHDRDCLATADKYEQVKPDANNNCEDTTRSQEQGLPRCDADTQSDESRVLSNLSGSFDPLNTALGCAREQEEVLSAEEAVRVWTGGRSTNICSLLVSLHLVPWPGLQWRPLTMQQLLTTADVRRAYHRACRAVHPDHHMATSREHLASLVTKELNMAWLEFGNRHDYQTRADWVHFD